MVDENSHKSAYERERKARLRAEELLENKTREIFHINEQLKKNELNLVQSNEALTEFAFVASHDLKEPLRKIKTFSNFLLDEYRDKLPDEGKDYLDRMQKAVDRMDELIEGLLHYSRITRNSEPYVQIELNSLFKDIFNDLSIRIEETHAQILIPDSLPSITANSTQIRQLMQNLISNAIKFHQKDKSPVITIGAEIINKDQSNNSTPICEISVTDNGIGFDEKYSNKIFGIFQRLHAKNEYEGHGIGLAVCKRITERHKGEIRIKSTPNIGTTFIVSIPTIQGNDE
jgi:light-regulated signal transduction histidine kinase (bacteriophytochrome)